MKFGIRYYENASCKISACMGLPVRLRMKTRELSHVDVPENLRRQGMATQLLNNVCDEADAHGMTLMITVKPYGPGPEIPKEVLAAWYSEKFGFAPIQVEPLLMARIPFGSPKIFRPTAIASLINKATK